MTKYRLGAEELIELGRGDAPQEPRKPFFRGRVRLGDPGELAGEYISGRYEAAMGLLERVSAGDFGASFRMAPALRETAAEVLVSGAEISGGGSLAGTKIAPLFAAFEGSGTPEENGMLLESAARRVAGAAPEEVARDVRRILRVG